jgi:hypothetical protein
VSSQAPAGGQHRSEEEWANSGAESGERRGLWREVRAGGEFKGYLDLGGGGLIGEIARRRREGSSRCREAGEKRRESK